MSLVFLQWFLKTSQVNNMKTLLALLVSLTLSSCAYVEVNNFVQGDKNSIKMDNSASRSTKDLIDAAGSAYGDATAPQ